MADFDPDKYLEKKKKSEPFDPDKYLASTKPETAAQTFGRSAASLADTVLNTARGIADIPVRAVARAYYGGLKGVPLEQQEPLLQKVSNAILPQQDTVGRAFGVTGTPGYEQAPLRRLGNAVGETIGENVIQPISQATGLPEGYVGDIVNLGTMAVAPAVPKVVAPVVQAGKTTGQFFGQVPGGMLGRATGYIAKPGETPTGIQVPSSRIPLTETFTRPEDWAKFQRGELPYGQFPKETPISQLPTNAIERGALKLSGGEIPATGQAGRAFGERLGETYRNPITAAVDIGSLFATGVPFMTAARGGLAAAQGAADYLLARKGFDPNLPKQMEMYKSGQMPMPGTPPTYPAPGPVAPQLGYNPNIVIPAGTQPRTVNIEGQSYNLPYQINTSQAQTARAPQTATPVPDLAQLAAQRSAAEARNAVHWSQTAQKASGPIDPTGLIAQIRARQNQPPQTGEMRSTAPTKGPFAEPPKPPPEEPIGGVTVTPTPSGPQPQGGGSLFDPQNFNRLSDKDKLAVLRQKLAQEPQQTITPAQEKQMRKEMNSPKMQIEGVEQQIRELVHGGTVSGGKPTSTMEYASTRGQLTPIDPGDLDNATKGMANKLLKAGIGELPNEIPGVITTNQIIRKAYYELTNKTPKKKGPGNVSQMIVGEPKDIKALEQSLVSKRSFSEDLQKYRYGTEKNPLSVDEAVHLLESDFLPKQEIKDTLMGRKTDLTEYSIWYRDETGKVQNVQTHGGELKKIR